MIGIYGQSGRVWVLQRQWSDHAFNRCHFPHHLWGPKDEDTLIGSAGPPCETWSRARQRQVAGIKCPRPVQTRARPEGRLDLDLKEDLTSPLKKVDSRQTSFGSRLLGITMKLLAVAVRCGAWLPVLSILQKLGQTTSTPHCGVSRSQSCF